jgi:hypothetical protein
MKTLADGRHYIPLSTGVKSFFRRRIGGVFRGIMAGSKKLKKKFPYQFYTLYCRQED